MAGYIGSKASVVSSGAERKKTFTITGATTSLTGLNYTVGKVHVFQNGVRLVDGTDYTATNGTTITLTVAAQSGDNVVVISQAAFQVADALLTSGGTLTGLTTVNMGAETSPLRVGSTGNDAAVSYSNASTPTAYNVRAGMSDTDDFSIWTSDTKRLTVKDNGNVGIGTSSPSDVLHVSGGSSTDGILIQNPLSGSFYNAKLEFTRDGTSGGAKIQSERNSAGGVGMSFNYTASNTAEVNGTYTKAMTIDSSGNVGIGTSSIIDSAWNTASGDNTELAIDGNSGYGIMHFRGTGGGNTDTQYTQGVGDTKFYMAYDSVANLHRMTIEPSGAITTPTQPAFVATTTASSDITTQTTIPYNSNLYDRATNFNTANHRFTAPVTGLYTFTTYHWHKTGTGGVAHLYLYLNGGVNFEFRNTRASSHSEYNRIGFTTTVVMSANDYVHVEGAGTGGGQLHTSAGQAYSHFSGYLMG